MLLRFLKLRLIVNGMQIYALMKNKPVLVTMPTNPSQIVVTDGFHITRPVNLRYTTNRVHYLHVECAIKNDVLVGGFIFMLMLFAMGATSGLFVLQLLSTLPVIYILFLYYINRKDFIQLKTAT